MAWRITVDGEVFDEKDYTGDQAVRAADRAGVGWVINPLESTRQYLALLSVLIADRRNISEDEAHKLVSAMTMDSLFDAYQRVDDDRPTEYVDGFPPEAGAQSTIGSSGAPASSTGLPTSPDDNDSETFSS